ncbi:DUF1186 domain-containing protein [Alkalicoccobacillus murimartini]|uniref:HEAT repeat domain-containing protein n=1 Tax=Alkalicoccobacillus murimartini TaxID=171685 RepID=A0ABT9YL54_9BACI|nr:DUF1186 domain-containing protein [Alkalicoccobacillus murimartini]MDQ0208374.1 hypothetical protein [Alkalicoccobacillus murimartini]
MDLQMIEVTTLSEASYIFIPPTSTLQLEGVSKGRLYALHGQGDNYHIFDDEGNWNTSIFSDPSILYYQLDREVFLEKELTDLIPEICYVKGGIIPRQALKRIRSYKQKAVPYLLPLVQNAEEQDKNPYYVGHVYAIYLLAELGSTDLFPFLIESFMTNEKEEEHPLAHFLQEDGARILASVFNGNLSSIKLIIETKQAYPYARGQAVRSLVILVHAGELERDGVLQYFKYLLKMETNWSVTTQLVMACTALYPDVAYPEIKAAYQQGKVDEWLIKLENVTQTLALQKDIVLHISKQDSRLQKIQSATERFGEM